MRRKGGDEDATSRRSKEEGAGGQEKKIETGVEPTTKDYNNRNRKCFSCLFAGTSPSPQPLLIHDCNPSFKEILQEKNQSESKIQI